MKLILYYTVSSLLLATGLFAESKNPRSYNCELPSSSGKFVAKVLLNPGTQFMDVILDEGTRIKGYASTTIVRATGDIVYFLQGGTESNGQQLQLTIKGQGEEVEFRRSHSGHAFTCK